MKSLLKAIAHETLSKTRSRVKVQNDQTKNRGGEVNRELSGYSKQCAPKRWGPVKWWERVSEWKWEHQLWIYAARDSGKGEQEEKFSWRTGRQRDSRGGRRGRTTDSGPGGDRREVENAQEHVEWTGRVRKPRDSKKKTGGGCMTERKAETGRGTPRVGVKQAGKLRGEIATLAQYRKRIRVKKPLRIRAKRGVRWGEGKRWKHRGLSPMADVKWDVWRGSTNRLYEGEGQRAM